MADILPGYPQAEGAKMGSVIEKAGPASYTQVTPGSPPTGGQAIEASEFGLKYFEHVATAMDETGAYIVYWTPKVQGKVGVTSGILMWVTAAGGAEVAGGTDLSGHKVRLRAIGLD